MRMRLPHFAGVIGGMLCIILCGSSVSIAFAQAGTNPPAPAIGPAALVVSIEPPTNHGVRVKRVGAAEWTLLDAGTALYAGDLFQTGAGRAVLRFAESETISVAQGTTLQIRSGRKRGPTLLRGLLHFFHRGAPDEFGADTPLVGAIIRGTEFHLEVAADGTTTLTLFDGEVWMTNEFGQLTLSHGEAARVLPGQAPARTAFIEANQLLQWRFYYPGMLDVDELRLSAEETAALSGSLAAYRSGDLLAALALYPAERVPASDEEKIYRAAVLLSLGRVDEVETLLNSLARAGASRVTTLAEALHLVIAAVKLDALPSPLSPLPPSPTAWLAESYWQQLRSRLEEARAAARQATKLAPGFSFAWSRLAELEFSFGRTRAAETAVEKSLALAPRNAEAISLKGFLLAAQNRIAEATNWFERALAIDPALGNAWLGRGLCRLRQGREAGGRNDLQMAATVEPQRALLRSYLGKAFSEVGDLRRAAHELELARALDAHDPTAWLYSALLNQQRNRINDGVRDLERSIELNGNRAVFRSQLLLDQDRAVRSSSLASLYRDAGLIDWSVSEAGRAVAADYANYSAHLFLANSYETQRRASLSTLRFEAAAYNEYLLSNLLGPANGRLLAQPVAQLEYSRLFERDGLGLIANTEYFSRGAWHHSSAQHGTFGGTSYSLEAEYRKEPGERVNQDLEIRLFEFKVKHDLTPDDSLLIDVLDYTANGGDTLQYFDATNVHKNLRFREEQSPSVVAGYHHQWSPENHTLLLASRFDNTLRSADPKSPVLALARNDYGLTIGLVPIPYDQHQQSRVEVYSIDAQHLAVLGRHSLIAGAQFQWTGLELSDRVENPSGDYSQVLGPISPQEIQASSSTASLYAYDYVTLAETLKVVGGVNYTHQDIPVNVYTPPLTSERERQECVNPKAGLIWSPATGINLRGSYTRSLNGFGLGQSVRLEPTQVAGFIQTFRAPVPRALVGALDGAKVETAEVQYEGRFSDTFVSVGGQRLAAERSRKSGLFVSSIELQEEPSNGLIRERIEYAENAIDVSVHQLVSREWSFGAHYRLAHAELETHYPEYAPALFLGGLAGRSRAQGWLQTLELGALYRHPSGLFGRVDGNWFSQEWREDNASQAGDQFWQLNLVAGYRFARQRGEVALGVLNATGGDYRLHSINQHPDLPRSRTFYARVLLNF